MLAHVHKPSMEGGVRVWGLPACARPQTLSGIGGIGGGRRGGRGARQGEVGGQGGMAEEGVWGGAWRHGRVRGGMAGEGVCGIGIFIIADHHHSGS